MATILTPPALNSAEETARFIDGVLAQAGPLRAQMQDSDAEISRLAAETQSLRNEAVRLHTLQRQAAQDMEAALNSLAPFPAHTSARIFVGVMVANTPV